MAHRHRPHSQVACGREWRRWGARDRDRSRSGRARPARHLRSRARLLEPHHVAAVQPRAARGEAQLAEGGPLVVDTGEHTGRSPNDKFIVREPGSEAADLVGSVNAPIEEERFEGLREKVVSYLDEGDVYVVDAFAGADPAHRLALRVVTESPWHALFAKTLFIDPTEEELDEHEPEALVLHAPAVAADPEEDGTRSGTFVVLHPSRAEVLIGGTYYAGEIKKSIFTRHERPAAARGRVPDALLGERRRRRPRGGVLRALRAPARRRSPPTPSAT